MHECLGSLKETHTEMTAIEVRSPLNGAYLGSVTKDSLKSVSEKIQAAKKAQPFWDQLGIKGRAQVLWEYRNLLKKNASELSELIHQENGKTLAEARAEVEKALEVTEFACALPQVMMGKSLQVSSGVTCAMSHRPLGVVASITPFNFPLMIPHWTAPIALMVGNGMILKPSPLVPLSASRMPGLFKQAGLPDGLFDVVHGEADVAEDLCEHEGISAISFVGSTPVAQKVYRLATSHLKRALCLGGAKNHLLVLPDADVSMTARDVVASMSGMAGQRCMAASVMVAVGDCDRIILSIIKEAQKIVCGEHLGAIISQKAKERIESAIRSAEQEGAQVVLDGRSAKVIGKEEGHYVGPTILDQVKPSMKVCSEEIFGPVLSIIRAQSLDEALAIQNQSPFGNGASIYTNSGGLAAYASEKLQAGMIGVNIGVPVPREPFSFGGMKASKFGVGDITGESSIQLWSQLVKCTTKWNATASTNWMS